MSEVLLQPSISMSLLDRLREQSGDAWQRLLHLFVPVVYQWGRQRGLQDADAVDVAQEVFLAVHLGLPQFHKDATQGSFRGWLFRITQCKVHDFFRRAAHTPQPEGGSAALQRLDEWPDTEPLGEAEADREATTHQLALQALELIRAEFAPRTWQAFHAQAIEGRPAADVADELGLSLGAVYVAKSRVFKRLRQELDGLL